MSCKRGTVHSLDMSYATLASCASQLDKLSTRIMWLLTVNQAHVHLRRSWAPCVYNGSVSRIQGLLTEAVEGSIRERISLSFSQ